MQKAACLGSGICYQCVCHLLVKKHLSLRKQGICILLPASGIMPSLTPSLSACLTGEARSLHRGMMPSLTPSLFACLTGEAGSLDRGYNVISDTIIICLSHRGGRESTSWLR